MNMRSLAVLSVLFFVNCFSRAEVRMGRSIQSDMAVKAAVPDSTIILSLTEVETKLPKGQAIAGTIIALYDPKSQLFWWMHESSIGRPDLESVQKGFLDSYGVSVDSEQITCFIAIGRTLWVRVSQDRFSSLEQGLAKAQTGLPEELAKFESGEMMWFHEMPIAQSVGQKFFHPKNMGDPPVKLRIGGIVRLASGWRVEIKNNKGESQTVIVNRDFRVSRVGVQ